jgi:hypothetical protein
MDESIKFRENPIPYMQNYFNVFRSVFFKILLLNLMRPYEVLNNSDFDTNYDTHHNITKL